MKQSAGILLYRRKTIVTEFLLVHPGGPFWKNKDLGAWSIPKGEFTDQENPLDAAKREFKEETGFDISGQFLVLTPIKQQSGKWVHAWAIEKYIDAAAIKSNEFEMEWSPKSGLLKSFPEVDRAAWFSLDKAMLKINPSQSGFITQLQELFSL